MASLVEPHGVGSNAECEECEKRDDVIFHCYAVFEMIPNHMWYPYHIAKIAFFHHYAKSLQADLFFLMFFLHENKKEDESERVIWKKNSIFACQ